MRYLSLIVFVAPLLSSCMNSEQLGLFRKCYDNFFAKTALVDPKGNRISELDSFYSEKVTLACRASVDLWEECSCVNPNIDDYDFEIIEKEGEREWRRLRLDVVGLRTAPEAWQQRKQREREERERSMWWDRKKGGITGYLIIGFLMLLLLAFVRSIFKGAKEKFESKSKAAFLAFVALVSPFVAMAILALILRLLFKEFGSGTIMVLVAWCSPLIVIYYVWKLLSQYAGVDLEKR